MSKESFPQDELSKKDFENYLFLDEKSVAAIAIERVFISYLAKKLRKKLPGASFNECALLVVDKTGQKYREWYRSLVRMETISNFLVMFGPPEGPERLFAELFPDQDIEDFLRSCLNGVESSPASRRRIEFREHLLSTINK